MKNTGNQQIEFDVFPKSAKDNYSYLSDIKKDTHSGTPSFTVALPQQSVIILVLCVVMLLVASFTLGVERGKLVSRNTALAPAAPWERVAATPEAGTAPQKAVATTRQDAAPAPATAVDKKDGPGTENYVIQVASLKTKQAASRLAEMLTQEGWPSFTKTSGDYVVVLAGSFRKREEAQDRIGELRKTYTDCFIKKI